MRYARWISMCAVSLAAAAALCAPAAAAPEGQVTEVQKEDKGPPSVLVNLGTKAGIKVGQTVEIRRGDKAIGYGSVVKVFKDLSVATVGTIVGGTGELKAGDTVLVHESGFNSDGNATDPLPTKPPPEKKTEEMPSGKVVNVRDGVVLLDFGRSSGLSAGHVVVLLDGTKEVGRISIELVGQHSSGGLLNSGVAKVGQRALSRGRPANMGSGIDFVALDFLGVVANLEHPTPHRAACHVGVPVRRILPGSPAEAAGVSRGDRVVSVDGIVVRDIASIRDRIQARASGRVRVTLIRGDRIVNVNVKFSK